jgi:hypothetical protein
MKTISELNSKVWHRFIKVVFILTFLIVLIGANVLYFATEGVKKLNQGKTLIQCTYGAQESFSPKNTGIYLTKSDFINGIFDYKEFFEGYNDYTIKNILKECYPKMNEGVDIFASQKVYEVWGDERLRNATGTLSETEREYLDEVLPKIENTYITSDKADYLDFSIKLFDIKPVFSFKNSILFFTLGNLGIILLFWIIRGIFYYIVFGSFRPQK